MSASNNPPRPTEEYVANWDWIDAHMSELSRDYGEVWIVVHDGHVLAADADLGVARAVAQRKTPGADYASMRLGDWYYWD